MSKLMHTFYMQFFPSCKWFDPLDVKQLLSLLESCAPASSLPNFKLAWNTATLLTLVLQSIVWIYPCHLLIICTFFFIILLLFLFQHLVIRWISWVSLHLRLVLNFILMAIFVLCFTWKLIYPSPSLLGRSWMDLGCLLCFLVTIGNTCQYVPKCFLLW